MSVNKLLSYEWVIDGEIMSKETVNTVINAAGDTIKNTVGDYYKYTIKVHEQIRGDAGKNMVVYSPTQGSACGVNYEPGSRLYLFIYDHKEVHYTGLCAANQATDRASANYKKIIRQYKKKFRWSKKWQDENGNMAAIGKMKKGLPVGNWTIYSPEGHLSMKGSYIKGKKHGNWKTYNSDGSINESGPYEDGLRNGTWTLYMDNHESKIYLDNHPDYKPDPKADRTNIPKRIISYEYGDLKGGNNLIDY